MNLISSSTPSFSLLRAVRIIVLAIVAATATTTTTRVFAQLADQKPDPNCSSKVSCTECLEAPCTWYGFGTCMDLEPVLMDVPRYSLDDGGTVQSVCETASNDKADADLCSGKLDCPSCFGAVLSDGRGTCRWFGEIGYCGSGCNMMGCGSETCGGGGGGGGRPPVGAPVAPPSMAAAGFVPQPPVGQPVTVEQGRPVGQPSIVVPDGGFIPQPPVGQPVGQPVGRPVFVRPSGQPVDAAPLETEPETETEPGNGIDVGVVPDASESPPPVEAAEDSVPEPEATDSAAASSEANSGACGSRTGGGGAILLLVLLALVNA